MDTLALKSKWFALQDLKWKAEDMERRARDTINEYLSAGVCDLGPIAWQNTDAAKSGSVPIAVAMTLHTSLRRASKYKMLSLPFNKISELTTTHHSHSMTCEL